MRASQPTLKVFATDASRVVDHDFIPAFHRVIQDKALAETLIDVTDYSHVHQGPGVMLIAHGAQYAMDREGDRLGLYHTRSRLGWSPEELRDETATARVARTFRAAFAACARLEADPALAGRLVFGGGELLFGINDRLDAPNDAGTLADTRALLEPLLARLYPGESPGLEHLADPRACFRVRIRAASSPTVKTLLDRLG